jgi:N-terminal half of MaoC dehydratase
VVLHAREAMEVEQIASDVPGKVLDVHRLLGRQPHRAQHFIGSGEHELRRWKRAIGIEAHKPIVNRGGCGACELLKNDRASKRLEPLRAADYPARADFGDNPGHDRIGPRQMRPCGARVWYGFGRHRGAAEFAMATAMAQRGRQEAMMASQERTDLYADERAEMRAENLHQGMRLGPIFYIVTAEQVRDFAAALHTENPLYKGDGAVAPPTMRLLDYALLIARHFRGGKGAVHAKQRCEFFEPMRAGQAVRVDGVVTATERKRGKFYFTLEYETRDAASDQLLTRQAITSVLLNPKGEMA